MRVLKTLPVSLWLKHCVTNVVKTARSPQKLPSCLKTARSQQKTSSCENLTQSTKTV